MQQYPLDQWLWPQGLYPWLLQDSIKPQTLLLLFLCPRSLLFGQEATAPLATRIVPLP